MIFLLVLMGHIIQYLYCCCCFSIVLFMAFNLIQKQYTLCSWHLSFSPLKPSKCLKNYFGFGIFFPIIKAKLHSELYMMIIVLFFLANRSLMQLLAPQLTLLRNFVFTMIYFPPHVNANQSSLTYKTFGYYLRRATKLNGKVKKT